MAEASTIARPYAQAVFQVAQASNRLGPWADVLAVLSAASQNEQIKALITNPNVDEGQLADLLISLGAEKMDQESKNFVKVLAENGRLNVISEIAEIYDSLKAEAEKTVQAEVVTAFELGDDQVKKLQAALKKRLGTEVEISSRVDESIIGGAIIRAGDMIIDGSVTSQLDRLSGELSH